MSSSEALTLPANPPPPPPPPPGESRRPLPDGAKEGVAEGGPGQEQEEREKKRKKRKMAAPSRDNTRTGTVMTTPLGDAMARRSGGSDRYGGTMQCQWTDCSRAWAASKETTNTVSFQW